jgi:hypothetical protein
MLKDIVKIAAVTALLSVATHPCGMVTIGGERPLAVAQIGGTVVGSGHIDLMGKEHDQERQSLVVPGATVAVLYRRDLKFIEEADVPVGMEAAVGNLKEWRCEGEVTNTKSDTSGGFSIEQIKPGKYCLEITSPKSHAESEVSMHASFPVDVVMSAPKAKLTANISPRWPDCSGGQSLKTVEASNAPL